MKKNDQPHTNNQQQNDFHRKGLRDKNEPDREDEFAQILSRVDFSQGSPVHERLRTRIVNSASNQFIERQQRMKWMRMSRISFSFIGVVVAILFLVWAIGNLPPLRGTFLPSSATALVPIISPTPTMILPSVTPTVEPTQVAPLRSNTFVTPVEGNIEMAVRSGPGTYYPQIGQLKSGEKMPALGKTSLGEWIKIIYPATSNETGWVYAKFVMITGDELPILADSGANPPAGISDANILGLESSSEEIRSLILHPQWAVVWVDGQSIHFRSDGSTIRFFAQAWLSQTGTGRVISSGQLENASVRSFDLLPKWVWLSDGKTLQLYDTATRSFDSSMTMMRWNVHPLETAGELMQIMFPFYLEHAGDQPMQIVREETFANRPALIIDWGNSRLWIDETSGVILRQQSFATPDHSKQAESDLFLSQIVYEPSLPGDLLDHSALDRLSFQNAPDGLSVIHPDNPKGPVVATPVAYEKPSGRVFFSMVSASGSDPWTKTAWLSLDCLAQQATCQASIQTLPGAYQKDMAGELAWSPDGKKFALISNANGNASQDIFIADANGDHPYNLTHSPEREDHPAWSSDGSYLLYVKTDANPEVWVSRPDGSDRRKIADGFMPSWSPDGRQILYTAISEKKNENLNIAIKTLTGGDPVWEMTLEKPVRALAWSPDGSKFSIAIAEGLLLMDRNRSNQIQLIPNLFGISNFAWSADGKYIAFLAAVSRQAPPNLYTIQSDGTNLINLTQSTLGAASQAAWSPDGNWLVYDSPKDSGRDNIFLSNPDGSKQYRLTQSDGSLEYLTPSWQPGN